MKTCLNYSLLLSIVLTSSCLAYKIKQDTTSRNSTLVPIDFTGRYIAVFDKNGKGSDLTYWLDDFYVESDEGKFPLLLLSRHLTDSCSDLDEILNSDDSTRIQDSKEHPKIIPGELFENKNTYEYEDNVIISFHVKGRGYYVSEICDSFYRLYNSAGCNQIKPKDPFFVFTSIESSKPLTRKETIDLDLVPLDKKGFEFGTCH